jgi:hypothetical protein
LTERFDRVKTPEEADERRKEKCRTWQGKRFKILMKRYLQIAGGFGL